MVLTGLIIIIMKKLILYSLVFSSVALGTSGCLKDDEHFTDFANVGMIAEIPSSAFYGIEDNRGLLVTANQVDYSFDVNIASPTPPGQDVTVTVAIDQPTLDAYNKANSTTYQLIPATLYQVSSFMTTVKAGTRLAPIKLSFYSAGNSAKVPDATAYNDAGYALPIKITSVSNNIPISSNYGYKIIFLKIKNQYDGDYHSKGTFTHPVNGPRSIDKDKTLATIDGATVQTEYADLGGSGWLMNLRVNADNTITLIPKGSANTGTVQFGVNMYDPKAHTYTLNYKYAGSGGDRVINEVITLK